MKRHKSENSSQRPLVNAGVSKTIFTKRIAISSIGILIGCGLLTIGVQGYNKLTIHLNKSPMIDTAERINSIPVQSKLEANISLQARLSLQPQTNRLKHRLGQRFLAAGKEVAQMQGVLNVNGQTYAIQINRHRDEEGEAISIALNGGPASLTWNEKEGAKAAGNAASGAQQLLAERLALDSPDQFILAQLRGASYYTVAEQVRPDEVGGADDYKGPVWDVIRIGEPSSTAFNKPQSLWRLYYLNCQTGLIDKIVSEENGEMITAEILEWSPSADEMVPTHIIWKKEKQVLMEITINAAAYLAG